MAPYQPAASSHGPVRDGWSRSDPWSGLQSRAKEIDGHKAQLETAEFRIQLNSGGNSLSEPQRPVLGSCQPVPSCPGCAEGTQQHLELPMADPGLHINHLANDLLINEFFSLLKDTWRMSRCHCAVRRTEEIYCNDLYGSLCKELPPFLMHPHL